MKERDLHHFGLERLLPKLSLGLYLASLLIGDAVTAAQPARRQSQHEIGNAASRYKNLSDFNWRNLLPGDTVRIHWRATPYHERLLIDAIGTAAKPITIEGVAGPNGELPIIDGQDATTSAQFSRFNITYRQPLGIVYIGAPANYPMRPPAYITIRNLEIRGGAPGNSFKDTSGAVRSYGPRGTAGLFVKGTKGVIAEGLILRDNGNGAFTNSNHDREIVEDFIFRNNYVVGNGASGSYREHGAYFEGVNTLVEGNRFGPTRAGSWGTQFKDRSAGLVLRYNYFEPGAPGRVLDLVDVQSDAMRALNLNQGPAYNQVYMYGNVIHHKGSFGARDLIHFGGDTWGVDAEHPDHKQGPLWFFNNTVVMLGNQRAHWRMNLFDLQGPGQTVKFLNNVVYAATDAPGATASNFSLLALSGSLDAGSNWLSENIAQWADNSKRDGTITGWEAAVRGTDPPFVDLAGGDLHLAAGSAAIDRGAALPAELAAHPVAYQHPNATRELRGAAMDLGAYE